MLRGINFSVKLDRPIDKDKDFISTGQYSLKLKRSGEVVFDFMDYYGTVDEKDHTILHVEHMNLDESFYGKDFGNPENFEEEDVAQVEKFSELFIYFEKNGKEEDINIEKILNCSLSFDDEDCSLTEKQLEI